MPMERPRTREGLPSITVYATNRLDHIESKMEGKIRKLVRHPFGITQFDRDGKASWPADQFTYRRLRDGDITLEPPAKPVTQAAKSPRK